MWVGSILLWDLLYRNFLLLADRRAFKALLFLYIVFGGYGKRVNRYLSLKVTLQRLRKMSSKGWLYLWNVVLNGRSLFLYALLLVLYKDANLVWCFTPWICLRICLEYCLLFRFISSLFL